MTDLIKREDAIKAIRECRPWHFCELIPVLSAVKDIPSVEPKRGEWERDTSSPIAYKCTACNTLQHWSVIQDGRYHFCPNCGCRMKGADDE